MKIYMTEVIMFEVEVRERLLKEMKERKIGFKEVINSVIKEYFEIKEIIRSEDR